MARPPLGPRPKQQYGRYLFDRERQKRRMRRLRNRRPRGGPTNHNLNARGWAIVGCPRQPKRRVPLETRPWPESYGWAPITFVPATEKGQFPRWVIDVGSPAWVATRASHFELVGYVKRPLLHLPHLRHLPRLPSPGPGRPLPQKLRDEWGFGPAPTP